MLAPVDGGYVAFEPSFGLLLVSLVPYWRIVLTIAVIAIVLSWFVGRLFARRRCARSTKSRFVAGTRRRRLHAAPFHQRGGRRNRLAHGSLQRRGRQRRHAMEERRQTEDRMRQFVADAGHELRTPLTVIGGYIDVLRRGAIEEPRLPGRFSARCRSRKSTCACSDRSADAAWLASIRKRRRNVGSHRSRRTPAQPVRSGSAVWTNRATIDYSVDGVADGRSPTAANWAKRSGTSSKTRLKYAARRADSSARDPQQRAHQISVRDEGPGMSEVGAHARIRAVLSRRPARRNRGSGTRPRDRKARRRTCRRTDRARQHAAVAARRHDLRLRFSAKYQPHAQQ